MGLDCYSNRADAPHGPVIDNTKTKNNYVVLFNVNVSIVNAASLPKSIIDINLSVIINHDLTFEA